jgi:hypothetical protein
VCWSEECVCVGVRGGWYKTKMMPKNASCVAVRISYRVGLVRRKEDRLPRLQRDVVQEKGAEAADVTRELLVAAQHERFGGGTHGPVHLQGNGGRGKRRGEEG